MLKRILAAVSRALKALGKSGWAALEDLYEQPSQALARTWDTIAAVGRTATGAVEWSANTIGAMMPRLTLGGGQVLPPEPPVERLYGGYVPRAVKEFVPDMSPSWYAAAAYIMGGKVYDLPGVKEDFEALRKIDPAVYNWTLSLSQTEKALVQKAGFDAMVDHLKGIKTIDGVRLAGKRRVPDGILDAPAPKRQVAFELDDGYDLAPMARAI